MKNLVYYKVLYEIGGTESYLFYLCKKYKDRDIVVYYQDGDPLQIARLKKYVDVRKYNGEHIKCDRAFFNYHYDIIDNVEAKEYIQVLHTDYKLQDVSFVPCPKMTRYLAPTKIAAKHFTELTGLPCGVCANPISIDKPKRLLKLVSATRLSKEKGFLRMVQLANMLDDSDIPYQWTIFTNDTNEQRIKELNSPNVIYMKTRLDITPYIADADYLVQLSNDGEGFGYTPCEALCLGIPVIVTPVEAFKELGIKDGENGFIVDFDMNNVDIQKIYKSRLKFNYEPPKDIYDKLLEGKSNYDPLKVNEVLVKCIKPYQDSLTLEFHSELDRPYILSRTRAEFLNKHGFVKIL